LIEKKWQVKLYIFIWININFSILFFLKKTKKKVMQAYESRKPGYFATPAVQLIYALHTSLKMITSKSMEYRIEKHRQVATEFRDVVHDLGLKTVAQSEDMSAHGMTAIWVPEGIEVSSLVSSLASKGVQIAGGILDGLAGKYFRIG
jgi:alanine-glyoxylate transaminase/serine-glyoxylate transaminase/serine-pyruvate transaminase